MMTNFNMTSTTSGQIVGMLSLSSIILSPIVGLLFDKFGGHEVAATFALGTSAMYFAMLGFGEFEQTSSVWVLVAFMGLSYGLLPSALYPAIAECVPEESFTPVYSILVSSMNMVLAITTLLSGAISNTEIPLERRRRLHMGSVGGAAYRDGFSNGPATDSAHAPPDYTYVFMVFVMYCSLGTLTSGYTLYVKWYGSGSRGGGHRAVESTTLSVDMTADGNLRREKSAKGFEMKDVPRAALLGAGGGLDDDAGGASYSSFQAVSLPVSGAR